MRLCCCQRGSLRALAHSARHCLRGRCTRRPPRLVAQPLSPRTSVPSFGSVSTVRPVAAGVYVRVPPSPSHLPPRRTVCSWSGTRSSWSSAPDMQHAAVTPVDGQCGWPVDGQCGWPMDGQWVASAGVTVRQKLNVGPPLRTHGPSQAFAPALAKALACAVKYVSWVSRVCHVAVNEKVCRRKCLCNWPRALGWIS